jgi:signal transduction histidine kinase/DNA-binding response OmpR family regulator
MAAPLTDVRQADERRAAILVVDDRPEQRFSLSVVLSELGDVVEASSGREALRWLLRRDFAVVLLDVNMPGMDGFETAALIRQRRMSQHIPIIFVTAYGDDTHAAQGYSLGAVDFILSPVNPQILRAKVSVFLELFRKSEEANRSAASLQRYASQLRRLAEAAIAIHTASSLDDLLKIAADSALSTLGAKQVAIHIDAPLMLSEPDPSGSPRRARHALQRPERTALETLGRSALVHAAPRVVRLSREQLDGHPQWGGLGRVADEGEVPLHGWLAAPLSSRQGRAMGWIQLSEKQAGDFTAEDEVLVIQLAQMVSIAAENTLFNEIQEASRLKDQFLATLSHELRTPLQSILMWAATLRGKTIEKATLRRGLEVIERNAHAQTQLIEDLLDVSRIISGNLVLEKGTVELRRVIETAVEDAQAPAREKGVEIDVQVQAPALVVGDPHRLRQILGNLLSNAIKFTPTGGKISVQLGLASTGTLAQIAVRDTGKGIAHEFLPHLFERFRQADSSSTRSHRGLGIGLAIVRHLVQLHGGTVQAESDGEGQGATFLVRLPVATSEQIVELGMEPAEESESPARLEGVRVLLVEDEPDSRDCIAHTLAQFGAEVTVVGSAAEAFAALEASQPDVLVSDLAMPGEDGFSLIRRIRARPAEQGGRVPAAALSAFARAEERARAMMAGFDLHLAKPVDALQLASAVLDLAARPSA